MAIFPSYIDIALQATGTSGGGTETKVMRLIRLFRVLRLLRVWSRYAPLAFTCCWICPSCNSHTFVTAHCALDTEAARLSTTANAQSARNAVHGLGLDTPCSLWD